MVADLRFAYVKDKEISKGSLFASFLGHENPAGQTLRCLNLHSVSDIFPSKKNAYKKNEKKKLGNHVQKNLKSRHKKKVS